MNCKVNVLVSALLVAAFIAKSADAIKCYQCDECPDAHKLPGPRECTKATWFDAFIKQTEKTSGEKIGPGPVKDALFKQAAEVGIGPDAKPGACFKHFITFNNKELVYRGCSPPDAAACSKLADNGATLCICQFDGCNSAPAAVIPSFIAFCFLIVASFMYA